ncbi:MAG: YciI family protein [Myxococcales bacterium]|nr:YciI family protein [Myxococcales bacterium]
MQYLLLFNKDEAKFRALSEEQRAEVRARYEAYGRRIVGSSIYLAGAALQPTDTATTVRVREGRRLITDGPFAETAEQIAGIALIDVPDLDTALEWAATHPDAEWASVEVRPVIEWEPPAA